MTPMRRAPPTLRATKIAVKAKEKRARRVSGFLRSPRAKKAWEAGGVMVPPWAAAAAKISGAKERLMTTRPESLRPIKVMKRPIPVVMAIFIEAGMPSTII